MPTSWLELNSRLLAAADDESGENEGDRYDGTSKKWLTPEAMAFYCEDAKHGMTTGVSARDKETTVLALASKRIQNLNISTGRDIFSLLKYREGGVLKRAAHTVASVDLDVLAGLEPVGVLYEAVDDVGSVARLPTLREFAKQENLKIVSIADLISLSYEQDNIGDGQDVLGHANVPLRAQRKRHRFGHKLRCYNQQDNGCDTMEANVELGSPIDSREYGIGALIVLP
ncbi:hypothetical protein NL676_039410 [Syzygium grande]|nr:hypothetical protein NL676_039410 [Syzygium grande]